MLIRQLPPTSRTYEAIHGEVWTASEQLLAHVGDLLALANWQRGNAGLNRPSPKPKPLPRPGHDKPRVETPGKARPDTTARMRDWRARHSPRTEAT